MRTWLLFVAAAWALPVGAEPPGGFRFTLQLPGPNPILCCGTKGAWDESVIEACDVTKDFETYYLYYHGVPKDHQRWGPGGYRIGLATARHPLGPWTKLGDKPLIEPGPPGSWDDHHVACAMVLREAPGKYLMWYSGRSQADAKRKSANAMSVWHVGLARAAKPEGPWVKYEKNPIVPDFGYVGGVVHRDKYYLYTTYPLNSTAPDYAPVVVATADTAEGPWTRWPGNPVLPAGPRGAWDDGGYSEAKVTLWEGVFHMFYGGAKQYLPRLETRESIGYAWSHDGFHFHKYGANPVAAREANPNAAAFAEVHTLIEPPLVYAYHTLRYVDPRRAPKASGRTSVLEDLGVQILVMRPPFFLPVPVLERDSLAPGASTDLADCPPIPLTGIRRATLTISARGSRAAQAPIKVHVRASADGLACDTSDLVPIAVEIRSEQHAQKSVALPLGARFFRVMVENPDAQAACRELSIGATLGSD